MLNITNHQDNANKTASEIIASYLPEWLLWKRQQIKTVDEDIEKWEFMHTVGGNVKNFHYESFSINEKYNYYMTQQFHFYLFKEITLIRKHLCIPCLLQH